MVPKLYDLAAPNEDQRSYAIEPVRLPVNSTALTKLSAMDRHADALLLLFDGACIMAPSVGRIGLSSRFLLLSEAMIAAHAKAPSARRQAQHP